MRTRSERRAVLTWVTAAALTGGVVVGALGGGAAAGAVTGAAPGGADRGVQQGQWPPPETIVAVEGDAENGFTVRRHDGSAEHPPTLSEALAECGEYDTEVDVAVCDAEVTTWYRDLGDLQFALRWARHEAARSGGGDRTH